MARHGSITSKLEALKGLERVDGPDRTEARSWSDYFYGRDDPVVVLQAEASVKDLEIKGLKLEVARLELQIKILELAQQKPDAVHQVDIKDPCLARHVFCFAVVC